MNLQSYFAGYKIDENSMFKEYGNNPNVFLYTSYKVNGFPDSRDIFVNLLLEENKTWRYDKNTNTIVIDDILCYDAPIGWEDRWRYYNYVMDIAKSI